LPKPPFILFAGAAVRAGSFTITRLRLKKQHPGKVPKAFASWPNIILIVHFQKLKTGTPKHAGFWKGWTL